MPVYVLGHTFALVARFYLTLVRVMVQDASRSHSSRSREGVGLCRASLREVHGAIAFYRAAFGAIELGVTLMPDGRIGYCGLTIVRETHQLGVKCPPLLPVPLRRRP